MNYNNKWLKYQISNGLKPEYIFFWGHQPGKNGSVGKSCFSQWFERGFDYKGIHYLTAEHWMMAGKAKLFGDDEIFEKIIKSTSAPEVKSLGRQVKNFDVNKWKANCSRIVCNGNYLKFTQNADLKEFLLSTEDKILVEASPYDRVWGIGMKAGDAGIENPDNWQGDNLLGYALMEVRDKLREE